jgi:hypothetical protein
MIHQPQAPSNYMGTRITICAVLGLIVTGFFIVYDAMVHRGAPSLPVSQASYRERAVERGSEEVKVPDMKSAGVAFASADVSPPAQFQSAQNSPENFATHAAAVPQKRQVSKVQVSRSVQEAHPRRLSPRIATVRKEGRAAYAQSFFGFAPFVGF